MELDSLTASMRGELLTEILGRAPFEIAILDSKLCYVLASARWRQLFGIDENELFGRSAEADLPSEWLSECSRALAGHPVQREEESIGRASGAPAWVKSEFHPWHATNPSSRGVIIFVEDVTEARGSRSEIEKQRAFLRQVIDINPCFVFAKDREGRFTLVNKALADAYGTDVETLTGRSDADYNQNAVEVEHFRRDDLEVMDSGREKFISEELVTDASGTVRWLQTVKRPIFDELGNANQVLGVSTDITKRKELEDNLRQAQKMEALGQLAGGVAHDFNNLLLVMMGFAEMSLMGQANGKDIVSHLQRILEAGGTAQKLIQQLLAFSRKQNLTFEVISLTDEIRNMGKMLRAVIPAHIEIRLDLGEPCAIKADVSQLQQVLVNLFINARDAIVAEGGMIAVRARPVRIEGRAARRRGIPDGSYAEVSVTDTGVGMRPDVKARIFEPFFTTKERGKGTGLGLSTVYGIICQHRGAIEVESEAGEGTQFRLYFPCVDEQPETSSRSETSAPPLQGSGIVLLVEDDELVRLLVQSILADNGYRTLIARNGFEAIEICEREGGNIDLLLTDVVMPGMSGPELYRRLAESVPELPVIYMSGYAGPDGRATELSSISSELIMKPFSKVALLERISARIRTRDCR